MKQKVRGQNNSSTNKDSKIDGSESNIGKNSIPGAGSSKIRKGKTAKSTAEKGTGNKANDLPHLKPHQQAAHQRYNDAKTQIALPNMSFKDALPFISIVGPKNSGQNELYTKLVKLYTRHEPENSMTTINIGTKKITVYSGSNNINTLIDLSKITDLAILTINGSHFEYETFEFVSLLKAHGLCKVLIVLTFDHIKTKRKNLKMIKKRLWKEIAGGLKVYDQNVESDIKKLGRDILQMKYRPIEWRCNNAFVVVDKIRHFIGGYDCYGYVKGCLLRSDKVHIPGVGDFSAEIEEQEDPCEIKERKMLDKEKKIFYSPKFYGAKEVRLEKEESECEESSEEESICIYDQQAVSKCSVADNNKSDYNTDAVNVMPKLQSNTHKNPAATKNYEYKSGDNTKECKKEHDPLSNNIILDKYFANRNDEALTTAISKSVAVKSSAQCKIEALKAKIKSKFEAKPETEEDYIEKFNKKYEEKTIESIKEKRIKQEEKNKKNLQNTAALIPGKYVKVTIRTDRKIEFESLTILGEIKMQNEILTEGKVKKYNYFPYTLKSNNSYLVSVGWERENKKVVFSYKDTTRNRFLKYILSGMHCNVNFVSKMLQPGTPFCIIQEQKFIRSEEVGNEESSDESIQQKNVTKECADIEECAVTKECAVTEEGADIEECEDTKEQQNDAGVLRDYKDSIQQNTDTVHGESIQKQNDARVLRDYEGDINQNNEIEAVYTICNKPDRAGLNKEAFKKPSNNNFGDKFIATNKFFRIAGFGTVTNSSGRTSLVKKLKLIGYPKKINEHTVFVKDMFTSDKEVVKFEGGLIKTVSGIRGSIKRAVGINGEFRATFEGRVLMSDIIFMRCYMPYEIDEDASMPHNIATVTNNIAYNEPSARIDSKRCVRNKLASGKNSGGTNNATVSSDHKSVEIGANGEATIDDSSRKLNKACANKSRGDRGYPGRGCADRGYPDRGCADRATEVTENLTMKTENQKKKKYEKAIESIKKNLVTEKLKKKENEYKMPISPFDRDFEKMKEKVEDKRKGLYEIEMRKKEESIKRRKIEEEKEKKTKQIKLCKNILESKEKKKHKKKNKRKR